MGICEYASISHFKKFGFCSERYLRDQLKDLQTEWGRALIKHTKYGEKKGGKKPYFYHLTAYGKSVAASACGLPFDRIKSPGKHPKIGGDYDHRFQQISFLIDLYRRASFEQIELEFFDHYFDWTRGKNRIQQLESLTRIYLPNGMEQQFIDPDGVFILNTEKGRKLYLFELHRGNYVGRLVEQIKVHRVIIKQAIAMQKYQLETNNRVIVLCEKANTQRGVLKKLGEDETFRKYGNYFLFKHLEDRGLSEVEQFGEGWVNGIGEKVRIY